MITHVKVAKFMLGRNGMEIILGLNQGGQAQLWERKTWEQYHKYIEENPQVRGTDFYPWTYIEDMNPPEDDLGNYVLLPEKTGGKEFIKTKSKNKPNANQLII